jgi:hypothetical protein
MSFPHFAQICEFYDFETFKYSSHNTDVSISEANFVGSILCNIGYDQFILTKSEITYDFNHYHFKFGNDLLILEEQCYEDMENHFAYFYLRNTSLEREYNVTDDGFPVKYYVLIIDRTQL